MSPEKPVRRSREIYTEILYRGLLAIRGAQDLTYAQALADHLHNLPSLLQNLENAGLHDFYRLERSSFLRQVAPEQAHVFESLWRELDAARKIETEIL